MPRGDAVAYTPEFVAVNPLLNGRGRMSATHPGWGRVVIVSSFTLALLILAFFYIPHWILTVPSVPSRGIRVWLATGWTVIALGGACYAAWRDTGRAPAPDVSP